VGPSHRARARVSGRAARARGPVARPTEGSDRRSRGRRLVLRACDEHCRDATLPSPRVREMHAKNTLPPLRIKVRAPRLPRWRGTPTLCTREGSHEVLIGLLKPNSARRANHVRTRGVPACARSGQAFAALTKAKTDLQAFSGSPLTDSNRRPHPYHGDQGFYACPSGSLLCLQIARYGHRAMTPKDPRRQDRVSQMSVVSAASRAGSRGSRRNGHANRLRGRPEERTLRAGRGSRFPEERSFRLRSPSRGGALLASRRRPALPAQQRSHRCFQS
jgi:hypothetical protein